MALGTAASPMRSAEPPESWFGGAVGLGLSWMPVATKHRLGGAGRGQAVEASDKGLPELCIPVGRRAQQDGGVQTRLTTEGVPHLTSGEGSRGFQTLHHKSLLRHTILAGDAWCLGQGPGLTTVLHKSLLRPLPAEPAALARSHPSSGNPVLAHLLAPGNCWPRSILQPGLGGRSLGSTHHPHSLPATIMTVPGLDAARLLHHINSTDPKCLSLLSVWKALPASVWQTPIHPSISYLNGMSSQHHTIQTQILQLSSCWDLRPPSHHPKLLLPPRLSW